MIRRRLWVCLVCVGVLAFATWSARPASASESGITGVVRDGTAAAIAGADVVLLTADQSVVETGRTDEQGRFTFAVLRPGRYLLVVSARGFAEARLAVGVPNPAGTEGIQVVLEPAGVTATVSVTASRGSVQDASAVAQPVTVIDASQVALRSREVVAQAVAEETGVHLLRTSPTVAGIYVRGLTGNKVNVFVDGVRYSTSAQRGGINTFLDMIEPTSLQGIEVLRGPNSAQYGSDALGGSVQFLSQVPTFAGAGGGGFHGLFSLKGGTASANAGFNASLGYRAGHVALFGNVAARKVDDLRPGQGIDSHAAVTRFFGLPSDRLMDSHLPDTGFSQFGGLFRLNWAVSPNQQVLVSYTHSNQPDGKRYDQLLGGDGNLVADLKDLSLDFFYVRYQRFGVGWFDQFTATYSNNSQYEERVNQGGNGNPKASITHEPERTNVNGFQAQLTKRIGTRQDLLVGGEYYPERIHAPSYAYNPANGSTTVRRGRVPDNAGYKGGGAFVQDSIDAVPGHLQLVLSGRYSGASYESLAADSPLVNGQPLWPDDSLSVQNATFRAGATWTPGPDGLSVTGNVSRGFRAPHVTDLGTLGLTGSGYQVSASSVAGMGATVGTTAGANAVSSGITVDQVAPETSLSYEAGVHYRSRRFSTELFAFVNDVYANIASQALILPQGAVGKPLGDQVITSQNANGVVYVPASSSPVLVRTNYGDARIYGFEHNLQWRPTPAWTIATVATYLHAADKSTGVPPNIEGGTPAPDLYLKVRYMAPGARWWVEPYVHLAATQDRLSSLDVEDRRTGATRTRSNIKNFFYNGATVRGWVSAGKDGVAGNADDILTTTGETLAQIQARVLGTSDSAPLYTEVAGYTTVGVRGAVSFAARHELAVDFENVGDTNYRGIAWGIDAPGRNLTVSWRVKF
jgi:hemoglobin/transferrin/lactoferrin receptor protein